MNEKNFIKRIGGERFVMGFFALILTFAAYIINAESIVFFGGIATALYATYVTGNTRSKNTMIKVNGKE